MPDCQRWRIIPEMLAMPASSQATPASSGIDDPAENVFRESEQRLDDDCAVDLVDVILVDEQLVAGGQCGGELGGALGLAPVIFVRDQPAFKRDENGDDAEDEFEDGLPVGNARCAAATGAR